ncbi:hypothetical protein [Spiroplasma platyhelix]|uniref:Uncharacterized protein n=1 Tax=Spiroplasma platyhelix PALS-1 TaxID=1276218 RepID=A0A846U1B3_9MOLU|nr:hypothetical protein [Spiroplasma platyhelix]MBE4703926.1 hypothetical protein [Spiroplasma platyhelix PALS-1]NKE38299.1 hypothetical protein [Spiroplasma platyhelix PALS-1]UJB29184.1 hypothetical protein SPLAT_v1c04200 [Spiroplasma platyhelix PALS-1]
MIGAYVNSWQEALVTLVILLWVAFIFCGTLVGLWLCRDNNKWGILVASIALPIIGTAAALGIMQVKYKTVDKWVSHIKQKNKKQKTKKHKKVKKTKSKKTKKRR